MTLNSPLDDAAVEAQLPAQLAAGYFNTGTVSPLPKLTHAAMVKALDAELGETRVTYAGYLRMKEHAGELRAALAKVVGADVTELALTSGTTEGVNIVLWGLSWTPGDIVVTTNAEHGGVLVPLYQLRSRCQAEIEFADVRSGDQHRILEAMQAAIRPGVKLVVLSHVTFSTGAVLPVREITELAHRAGALVLLDGAQSVGAIPADFHALGVDFCAFSGHKWLCGPGGTGALYVRRQLMDTLMPTYISSVAHQYSECDPGSLVLSDDATRYERGAFSSAAILGLEASISWLSGPLGLDAIYGRTSEIGNYCLEKCRELTRVEILAPADRLAGLIAFTVADGDPDVYVKRLLAHNIHIRSIHQGRTLRFSVGFFNSTGEIDRAVDLIEAIYR